MNIKNIIVLISLSLISISCTFQTGNYLHRIIETRNELDDYVQHAIYGSSMFEKSYAVGNLDGFVVIEMIYSLGPSSTILVKKSLLPNLNLENYPLKRKDRIELKLHEIVPFRLPKREVMKTKDSKIDGLLTSPPSRL